MSSLILLGWCAPRLCPSPQPAPPLGLEPGSAPRRARRPPNLLPPQSTSTLPSLREAHRGYKRRVLTTVPWHLAVGSISSRSPRAQPIHRGVHTALVLKNTRRLTSKRVTNHRQSPLSPSSRSLGLPSTFFEWPLARKSSYVTAHRGLRDLDAPLV